MAMPTVAADASAVTSRSGTTTLPHAFAIQGVSLAIDPGCTTLALAEDAGCFASVIEDLAATGASGSAVSEENLFHAIRYLSTLAKEYVTEIERRMSR